MPASIWLVGLPLSIVIDICWKRYCLKRLFCYGRYSFSYVSDELGGQAPPGFHSNWNGESSPVPCTGLSCCGCRSAAKALDVPPIDQLRYMFGIVKSHANGFPLVKSMAPSGLLPSVLDSLQVPSTSGIGLSSTFYIWYHSSEHGVFVVDHFSYKTTRGGIH